MITVVVPVCNEEENIKPLLDEIVAVSAKCPVTEIIYVDDASTDQTLAVLREYQKNEPRLRIIRHSKRSGQSAAIATGVNKAADPLVATLDGDGQNDPADIEHLYTSYRQNGLGNVFVAGQRVKREDHPWRSIASKIANTVRAWLLKDGARDTGCGIKLFRKEDFMRLPYFNHMHRYMPALMRRHHVNVIFLDVSHRARARGTSKYGTLDRLWAALSDLFGVMWLNARAVPDIERQEIK
ncbi:MAG: glycosyltransferase [Alphaproteobacteria bacterium]|nr:glycosyltransferase [Alphaproteobacteria bacterium]